MSAIMRRAQSAPASTSMRLLFLVALATAAQAVLIEFENCLPSSLTGSSDPVRLQWVPLFFDAKFDITNASYPLRTTLYGNVTGQQVGGPYPPANSSDWTNPAVSLGKITDVFQETQSGAVATTLFAEFDFLTYNAYTRPPSRFCSNDTLISGSCPLGPLFSANASDPSQLHAFSIAHDFYSPYAFSTLATVIKAGDGNNNVACVSASITPDIGNRIRGLLTWLPAAILIFKAIATLAAAIYSPWGSSDIFRWSSNYGRDEDLLRLVTPGFGDCLQYIQFIMLTGSLTVQYPGFYQPAVAQTSWSCLLFNESFVSHGPGTRNPIDGIYAVSGQYGLERMSQLIGMTNIDDIWACMAIWLAVITGIVILLCQLGFLGRWIHRKLTDTTEEDLRRKNLPFTAGSLIRLLFNFFILPIVALSFFQLITAADSPIAVVVMSAILLVAMILSAAWILRFIFRAKPRTFLFDDMPTVLLYGPLYNTYSDSAAPFAFVPVFITFIRGVAIGAVQPSGIAQIVILAICEVILILTVNGLRPFQNQTSMNLYHTLFSTVRMVTVLLQIAFVPSLNVGEGPKGWIGYVILILHASVLVFGFFLNAAQALLEVVARAFGIGGNTRGNILSSRMLKRRQNRPVTADGQSLMSGTHMLRHADESDATRSRSMSTSSQQLLNQTALTPSIHRLSGFENFSSNGDALNHVDTESTAYHGAAGRAPTKRSTDLGVATDNFYRPPRPRRGTLDLLTPGAKSRQSTVNPSFPYSDSDGVAGKRDAAYDRSQYASQDRLGAAYLRDRIDSDAEADRPDYAVREVDQYYRGPALAGTGPQRKLKTGPADPQSPASNAQSWFQRVMFGLQGRNKQKEQTKGFEIVRSTRAPPPDEQYDVSGQRSFEMMNSPPTKVEPYQDSPPKHFLEPQMAPGAERESPADLSNEHEHPRQTFNFAPIPAAVMPGEIPPGHRRDTSLNTLNTLSTSHPALRPSMDTDAPAHPGLRAEVPSRGITPAASGHSRSRSDSAHASAPVHATASTNTATNVLPALSPIDSIGSLDLRSRFGSQSSVLSDDHPARQNWLAAVDNLSWNDYSRGTGLPHNTQQTRMPPVVPDRSPRRPPSETRTPARVPAGGPSFGSRLEPEVASPSHGVGYDQDERPTSFVVNHHRAVDSITRNSFGAGQIARQAEMYDADQPPARQ